MSNFNSSFENASVNKAWSENLETYSVAYWVIKVLIAIATIVGNGFVIYLIVTRRKLHTTDNWFILSLSLSDLFVGLYITPSELFCHFIGACIKNSFVRLAFPNFVIIASIFNLCVLTCDRYIAILYPLHYVTVMTSSRVKQLIFVAWFIPALITIVSLLPLVIKELLSVNHYLTILWIILITVIPSVALVLMYLRIYIVVKRQQKRDIRLKFLSSASLSNAHVKQRSRDRSSVNMLGVVILFFVLCWQPSVYRAICEDFKQCHVTNPVKQFARVLILVNSSINFVVYALLKKDLRKEFLKMYKKIVRERSHSTNSGRSASSGLSATSVRYLAKVSTVSRVETIDVSIDSDRTLFDSEQQV